MKNVLILLQEYSAGASPAEQGVIRFILNAPETAANSNIRRLSELSYTSQSTIVRLCAKIGFSGYKEFRQVLYVELEARELPHGGAFRRGRGPCGGPGRTHEDAAHQQALRLQRRLA